MKSWLHKYRNTLLHITILTAYICYMLFLAGPLFRLFQPAPKAYSSLVTITLPSATNNVNYFLSIDMDKEFVSVSGWAFIEGLDAGNSQIFLVLQSPDNTYVYNTAVYPRPDVTSLYNKLNWHLDNSGFLAPEISLERVLNNTYTIGIYIKNGTYEALQYTDRMLVKTGNSVQQKFVEAKATPLLLIQPSGNMLAYIDHVKEVSNGDNKLTEIAGWAFITDKASAERNICIVLRSSDATYIYNSVVTRRPDLLIAYKESAFNVDDTGFITRIASDEILPGAYHIGVYIKGDDAEAFHYLDKTLVKSADSSIKLVPPLSCLQKIALPQESDDLLCFISTNRPGKLDDLEIIEVEGWAFIKGQDTYSNNIYAIFKSDDASYVFDTSWVSRPDVTAANIKTGFKLDNSGFVGRIPKNILKNGRYHLELFIDDGTKGHLQNTGYVIDVNSGQQYTQYTSQELEKEKYSVLNLLLIEWQEGFSLLEGDRENNWRWCSAQGTLIIINGSNKDRKFNLKSNFVTGHTELANLKIEGTLLNENLQINNSGYDFEKQIIIPPGKHIIKFSCDARQMDAPGDPRYIVWGTRNFQLLENE